MTNEREEELERFCKYGRENREHVYNDYEKVQEKIRALKKGAKEANAKHPDLASRFSRPEPVLVRVEDMPEIEVSERVGGPPLRRASSIFGNGNGRTRIPDSKIDELNELLFKNGVISLNSESPQTETPKWQNSSLGDGNAKDISSGNVGSGTDELKSAKDLAPKTIQLDFYTKEEYEEREKRKKERAEEERKRKERLWNNR